MIQILLLRADALLGEALRAGVAAHQSAHGQAALLPEPGHAPADIAAADDKNLLEVFFLPVHCV